MTRHAIKVTVGSGNDAVQYVTNADHIIGFVYGEDNELCMFLTDGGRTDLGNPSQKAASLVMGWMADRQPTAVSWEDE